MSTHMYGPPPGTASPAEVIDACADLAEGIEQGDSTLIEEARAALGLQRGTSQLRGRP